ncbi:MAG: DUF5106 domain-containing protein [Bacteroidales bacterium]|jgi:hypothetical protein|nr:DUF5106 domain-containing protein [Bacteroidales bacterium]MDD2263742.1 DUF5106 domain-containing protein [Bacteroidales bacterium]MDD2831040.1 DUF5106 domain-containing protein [Bacteroidales bacterium]MDD3208152.1 DUF5106 domain-containing protein [Bacteroidales bacterium]MDD3696806.1 DUF5106 domain-containing protein [Bacteroidales bacterium]
MNLPIRCLAILMTALTVVSCIRGNREKVREPLVFFPPSIPVPVTSQEEALRFRALHYWDTFPFDDSLCIRQEGFADQAYSAYADILHQAGKIVASEGISRMMDLAGTAAEDPSVRKQVLLKFYRLSEYYYYHPNSPYRDDELFMAVLEKMVASPLLDTMDKQRHVYLLKLARKNRVGSQAEDFSFVRAVRNFPDTDDPSSPQTLYQLRSDYVLILFINLDCASCRQAIDQITSSGVLSGMVKKKRLTILTIYPDKELEGWQKYLPELPPDWIHAYDPTGSIRNGSIYDLKAIPSLYLLDSSKRVLVRDALSIEQIEEITRQKAHFL